MARKMHEPLYRPVLRDAFHLAWHEKRYWWIALFAGILLTGSVYDVVWRGLNSLSPQATISSSIAKFWDVAVANWSGLGTGDAIIGGVSVLIITAFALIIGVAIFAMSAIAQGALIYGIGNRRGDRSPPVRDALTVGAKAVWPIIVLNIFALAVLWATRALIGIALAASIVETTATSYLIYLLAFMVFIAIAVATSIVQILALNSMILQGATLAQAIERGLTLLKKHWVIVIETATILFLISFGAFILTIALSMMLTIPMFVLAMISIALNMLSLFWATLILGIVIFIALMLTISAVVIQLHYATWAMLYRRLGEGGVLPKLHRFIRSLFGLTHVPGS